MTKAPSIKEALELLPCPFCNGDAESDSQRHYRNISTGNLEKSAAIYCTKCNADMTWCYRETPEIEREQVMSLLTDQWNTRTTLQPSGERREAIARLRGRALFLRNRGEVKSPDLMEQAAALLASGLQDEAVIRADELEKLFSVVTDKLKDETSERYAKGWNNALISVCAAIRSARNGGGS